MKQIFVIYGKRDAGKTHTSWLVYNLLKTIGKKIVCKTGAPTEWTYNDVLSKINDFISDFRAIVEINNHRVGVISAGDTLKEFRPAMQWVNDENIEILICCARRYNRKNSVHKELRSIYSALIYKWYFKTYFNIKFRSHRIHDAEAVARKVFDDVKTFV